MKSKKGIIIGAVVAIIVAIIALVIILIVMPTKVKVGETVTVKFDGYNGYGKASLSNAYDWTETLKLNSSWSVFEQAVVVAVLEEAVDYSLSETKNLSNGDKVTLTIDVDQEVFKQFGFTAKSQTKTVKVSGLQEPVAYNPFDYVTAEPKGYESYGELTFKTEEGLLEGLKFTADKMEGLSNGDVVTVNVEVENPKEGESLADYCGKNGYKVEKTSVEYTVSGLEKQKEYDPFQYVDIKLEGIAPYVTLTIEPGEGVLDGLYFTVSQDKGLSNGDEVIITVMTNDSEENDVEKYCLKNGYRLKAMTYKYTISDQDTYVRALDEIPAERVDQLKNQADTIIRNQFAASIKNMNDAYHKNVKSLVDTEYCGLYLFNEKSGANREYKNLIVVLHKVTATSSEGNFEYYYATVFGNAMLLDGKDFSIDLENYSATTARFVKGTYTLNYIWVSTWDQYYDGYVDLESFRTAIVDPWSENYEYVTNVE